MATEELLLVIKAKNEAQRVIDGVSTSLGGLKTLATTAAVAAGATAVTAVAGVTKVVADGVGKAAAMEQRVADIASIMGISAEEAKPLAELITNLGLDPNLKVDANEAADAIQMLVQNGRSMAEVMDGAARSTVLLANATNADFGTAADIATDVMSLFNISADNMATAVNGITGVTTSSKFAIGDYRLALAQAGGVAAAVGVDFDDFNATIAAISPSFASGSDAGTSFKTFLQRLLPQSNEAVDTMRSLGLFTGLTAEEYAKTEDKLGEVNKAMAALDPTAEGYEEKLASLQQEQAYLTSTLQEGQNAFFNADGSMKSMSEIAGILQDKTKDLTEEQRVQAFATLFGTDAMRAAFALSKTGAEDIENLKKKIGDTSAEENASTRMNTLQGTWEIFQGQVDALSTAIGQSFLPIFKEMGEKMVGFVETNGPAIVGWFQGLASWFRDFVNYAEMNWMPRLQKFFGVISGAAEEIRKVWAEKWPLIAGYLTSATTSIGEDVGAILESLGEITGWFDGGDGESAISKWGDFFTRVIATLTVPITNLVAMLRTLVEAAGAIGEIYNGLTERDWGRAWAGAQDLAGKLKDFVVNPLSTPFEMYDAWQQAGGEGRASGGPVRGGVPYMVGERGRELFVPETNGKIIDASTTAAMTRTTNNYFNVSLAGSGQDNRDVMGTVQLLAAMYG